MEPIGIHDNFFDLGGHSLMIMQLVALIQKRMGCILPVGVLFRDNTVEALARFIRENKGLKDSGPLVPIKTTGSKPPLYLVHPVGGDVACYGQLGRCLSEDQPLYALAAPGLEHGQPLESVPALAASYLEAIREHQPQGNYLLGGWSLGGVIAMEMANQASRAGHGPQCLVLIDTWLTICNRSYSQSDIMIAFLRDRGRLSEADMEWVFKIADDRDDLEPVSFITEVMTERNCMTPEFEDGRLATLYRVFEANMKAVGAHKPEPYTGSIQLFMETEFHKQHPNTERSVDAYRQMGVDVDLIEMPGSHYTMLSVEENAQLLANRIEEKSGVILSS